MTDTKKPALNLDLETAENLMRAAGRPELADALSYHAHGVRNLVQGEWGQSFVTSLEGLLVKHVDPLVEAQKETHSGITALSAQFRGLDARLSALEVNTLAHVLTEAERAHLVELARTIPDLEQRIRALEARG